MGELNSAPVMQDGKPVYFIISWLDITERKRARKRETAASQLHRSFLIPSPEAIAW